MHMHAVDDQAILTMAIYVLSQAQHVMTKLLKSKDGCKLGFILFLTLTLGVLVYLVFFA